MARIVIDHSRLVTGCIENPVDDPANAAPPGQDDIMRLLYGVGFGLLAAAIKASHHLVVEDEQQRRDEHCQRHDQQQQVRQRLSEDEIGNAKSDQHEGEFARLRQAESE